MCGRFTLRFSRSDVAAQLGAMPLFDDMHPRYNIAPTQDVAVVRVADGGQRELVPMRWGLIPSWAADPKVGNRMINARSDTAATKPAFRAAFKRRRCLLPADGFYEWKKEGKAKQPYHIHLADGGLFGFAGLWETWRHNDLAIQSCTILTTDANEKMRELHDRMPVIVAPGDYHTWLDTKVADVSHLLAPYPSEEIAFEPVNRIVNSPANDSPACLEPAEA